MATVQQEWIAKGVSKTTWTLAAADGTTRAPVQTAPSLPDKTVQVIYPGGVTGTIVIEGSNDGVTFGTLNDLQGNPLSFTVNKEPEGIQENPLYIAPRASLAVAGGIVTVILVEQSGQR